jgi:transposase
MWKPEHRVAADRRGLRYPSDLIDAEWALVSSLIPPARRGGRKRSVDVREVLNAIFYVLSTGCQWKALPKDLPPKSTPYFHLMQLILRASKLACRRLAVANIRRKGQYQRLAYVIGRMAVESSGNVR